MMWRQIVYDFYQLDYPTRLKILLELEVIKDGDERLGRTAKSFKRIRADNLEDRFHQAITKNLKAKKAAKEYL